MRRRSFLSGAAAGLAVAALPPGLALAQLFPPPGEITYRVLREGERIGSHRMAFLRDGTDFIARTDIDVRVRVLGLTAFRYRLKAEETWRDGWLVGLRSRTNDDGDRYELEGERSEGALRLRVNGRRMSVSGYVLTSSLWHRDTPREQALLDIAKGRVRLIKGVLEGEEQVPVEGGKVTAKHYSITGELRRDVWYDDRFRLVRVEFPAKDGSWITVEPV